MYRSWIICGSRGACGMGSGLGRRGRSHGGGVWVDLGGITICDEAGEFGTFGAYASFRCLEKSFMVSFEVRCVPLHGGKQIARPINRSRSPHDSSQRVHFGANSHGPRSSEASTALCRFCLAERLVVGTCEYIANVLGQSADLPHSLHAACGVIGLPANVAVGDRLPAPARLLQSHGE